ncbi:MAG: hypothetical protein U0324_25395 [Polyangiales bacterium]
MPTEFVIQVESGGAPVAASLVQSGAAAAKSFKAAKKGDGSHVLLTGDRDYHATLVEGGYDAAALTAAKGRFVRVTFPGRSPVRRVLRDLKLAAARAPEAPSATTAVDLTGGVAGCPPLWVLPDGTFSTKAAEAQRGVAAREALVNAARWISGRRTSTFERLFPPSAFHPDVAPRPERLSAAQGAALLDQARGALTEAAVGSAEALRDGDAAAQLRSACATVLSHVVATALRDATWRALADAAAAELFALVAAEEGPSARPALRGHVILLLQLRAPALTPADAARAKALLRTFAREAPPYASLPGPWHFAMCSTWDFHEGEAEVIASRHDFKEVPLPPDAPAAPRGSTYRCFEAPFQTPDKKPVRVLARQSTVTDENAEMASPWFVGVLINRHAQLGSFDMKATAVTVAQQGYKVMMNSQCAGLTTRFALSRAFPDADLYSSWDSTYFRTGPGGKVNDSEGLDCFVALLSGMARRETHAQLERRIRAAQWYHPQQEDDASWVQFVGPANPLVVARYSDVNHDAKADLYDGFLDFDVRDVLVEMADSGTPRDPKVRASQVGGAAARSLGWAVGSLNRVAQYSDIWAALPGRAERFYAFESAGYFSHLEPPSDVRTGPIREDLGRLPAVCRYTEEKDGLRGEVMFHAWLAHAAEELKRLLVAAEVMNRAFDLKLIAPEGRLATPQARRGALLLTMAGLLEFPSDQNRLDGLWSAALRMLNLPDVSRSLVRACITEADHDASNYYGSHRGLRQLVGGDDRGDLGRLAPAAWERIASADPLIGRALPLAV